MQIRLRNFLLIFCLISNSVCVLFSQQTIFQASQTEFEEAASGSTLLQNQNSFLPVRNLDSLEFYCFQYGTSYPEILEEALDRYIPFSKTLLNELTQKKSGVVILSLRKASYTDNEISEINTIIEHHNTIVIIAHLDAFSIIPELKNANSIIHQFVESPLSNEIVAQQIFGGAPIQAARITDPAGNQINPETERLRGRERLGFAPPASKGINGDTLEHRIDAIVQEGLDSMAYPGCQVLVAYAGKVIFHKTYGYHTYDKKLPVRTTDIYDLASVTKISSATTALMKLNGEGKFDLDAPLKRYFPKFSKTDKANLEWRQILAHNARLKAWIPYWTTTLKKNGKYRSKTLKTKYKKNYPIKLTDQLYLHKDYKEKKIYKMIAKSPMNENSGYLYSGLSFYLYPEIVETITGRKFEDYLKTEIYLKLGATTITYNPMRFYPLERIIPTEHDTFFRKIQLHGIVHDEGAAMMNGISANAGLFSSTLDLAKLMQLFLNGGTYGRNQILKPEVIKEFTRCQYCDEGNRRGLGFEKPMIEFDQKRSHVSKYVSKNSFGHSGYTGTFTWVDPDNQLIFIFMSNRVFPTRLNRKLYTMNIRPRIQDVIYEEVKNRMR
jgi:CubicO group peptidase (beta-lactamase class C family)